MPLKATVRMPGAFSGVPSTPRVARGPDLGVCRPGHPGHGLRVSAGPGADRNFSVCGRCNSVSGSDQAEKDRWCVWVQRYERAAAERAGHIHPIGGQADVQGVGLGLEPVISGPSQLKAARHPTP